jgi:retinol dehydrogenase-13
MNRIGLVTGATGAIGKAIARQLAEHEAFEVVLACQNGEKARQVVTEIQRATDNPHVR